ncbi:MAG: RNase adapter RapZ [Candidatus Eremiobacteraeota bacterium]|nr:RNase adapter RapZ [Candidatus Eremiobacteraeota bacterium]
MKTFEDLGFYCVDNLPPTLVPTMLELLNQTQMGEAAIALDVRSGGALGEPIEMLREIRAGGLQAEIAFLDAQDDVLVRRYSETRRRHPFGRAGSLGGAISSERNALAALRTHATHVIDTSELTHAGLKERITTLFESHHGERRLSVAVIAFGFKYGIPLDLDLLFDVRFLRNPNYVESMRTLTGLDPIVRTFIQDDPALTPFLERLHSLLDFLVPHYVAEGKSQLTIGVGCTGGRHRSVFVAKELADHLSANSDLSTHLHNRDTVR